jgi:hypothetical protein
MAKLRGLGREEKGAGVAAETNGDAFGAFYWLSLPHLDCHVNHDWLHIERFHGAVPGIWADRI